MGQKDISIVKMNGEKAMFNESKLRSSLERAGASDLVIQQVINDVAESLYDGISTKEIYKTAFALLRKNSRPTAARYKLKKAIMELGETGFPFEKFVAALLDAEEFKTQVGVIIQGKCVTHEVDVIVEKENKHFMCECKFHKRQGRNCDVKIPLYIQSRFKDVEAQWQLKKGHNTKFHQGWIFTNTRFTSDAIKYSECSGLQLVSWDYPKGNGIKERVDKTGVHPITCLTSLTKKEKRKLIDNEIITCKDLCNNPDKLNEVGIDNERQINIMDDAKAMCSLKPKENE